MVSYRSNQLEIARRHRDLWAAAERHRIAKALDHTGVTPTARRPQRRVNASRSHSNATPSRNSDVEVGLEV